MLLIATYFSVFILYVLNFFDDVFLTPLRKYSYFIVLFFAFLLLGCGADSNEDVVAIDNPAAKDSANKSGKSAEYKIYLITMDLADDFWQIGIAHV